MSIYGDGGAPFPPVNGTEPCKTIDDPQIFFTAGDRQTAKELCGGCHVREQCLAYALTHDVQGVWGGSDETERRKLQRKQHLRPVPILLPLDADMVVRAHQRGMSTMAIAQLAGVTQVSVEQVLSAWRRRVRAHQAAAS